MKLGNIVAATTVFGLATVFGLSVAALNHAYKRQWVIFNPGERPTAHVIYGFGLEGKEYPVEFRKAPEQKPYPSARVTGKPIPYASGIGGLVSDCQGSSTIRNEISSTLTKAFREDPGLFNGRFEAPYSFHSVGLRPNETVVIARDPNCVPTQ